MALKPWYNNVDPREDLLENKSLDQSEFAVHLDQVRDLRAPDVYTKPAQFFERTFLTQNLTTLASEVLRRLSGETASSSPVFNLATQFGGGKTHALTLLYHLANEGSKADGWMGVSRILDRAGMKSVPKAQPAVFVGTQFDSVNGRGGTDGEPLRHTPWGEIAYQLGGDQAFAIVAEHDRQRIAPGGDVIRQFIPTDTPSLILIDEVMNYVSRYRNVAGLGGQFYNFLQNLSEEVRGLKNVVLAVSIPKSELEMTADDQSDYQRFDKMLNRLGKAIVMSAEDETSEIIRRRLFQWDPEAINQNGKVILSKDAIQVCNEYADWVVNNRGLLPEWFPVDNAREAFMATYPFHPSVISVFERKWQALPQFQRTRGVLQMLALWMSRVRSDAYEQGRKDLLIGLGSAPLEDSTFRTPVFEQLGEDRLEPVVTTDICGRKDSHAVRRDAEAVEAIRKARMHQKVATVVFFESNGGQQQGEATVPEIRLAVGEPGFDIGHVESILEALTDSCYYLQVIKNKYQFSHRPNLNKILADRRATIQQSSIEETVREQVQKIFQKGKMGSLIFFPSDSGSIPNQPALTFVVLPPEQTANDDATLAMMEKMTREYGSSGRTFKSALIWCVADSGDAIYEEARKLLAWRDIKAEYTQEQLGIDQHTQLQRNIERAQRALDENIWRAYRFVYLLAKDNSLQKHDLGGVSSSASESLISLIVSHLSTSDELLTKPPTARKLVSNWPPALTEWSTRAVRDAFYASPIFPRLMNSDLVRTTIARAVQSGDLAYVSKGSDGQFQNPIIGENLSELDIDIDDDTYIITRATYDARRKPVEQPSENGEIDKEPVIDKGSDNGGTGPDPHADPRPDPKPREATVSGFRWQGAISHLKWMTFYNKVIARFVGSTEIEAKVVLNITSANGIPEHQLDEMRAALRELGLEDEVKVEMLSE